MFSKDDIYRFIQQHEIKFVRLQFSDILGTSKNVAVPVEQLGKALDGEMMFDGSSIEGFVRVEESDMYLRPDLSTLSLLPWKSESEGATARIICDVYNPDGTPFSGCPRNTLKRVIAEAGKMGYSMNVGPEAEFFLFLRDRRGRATTRAHDCGGYFDFLPVDLGETARRDMVITLQTMGFEIEASHHEVAPSQHEIAFKYACALTTADNIATFKLVVRTIALKHNLHATFMPKPVYGINGSGMHIHQSLFQGEENIFYDPSSPSRLSHTALYYIGGLMKYVKGFTAVTNPLVNSYKRLVPGYEAPVYIAWSERNRSPLIRVPARRGIGTRVEVRSPDPSCNPYLALAVTLKAGLEGIRHKVQPPDPVNENIYRMDPGERKKRGIESLPVSLGEAIHGLENCRITREALGEHIFNRYLEAKKYEWEKYRGQVHQWEIEQYLAVY